jgi:hypothetical protein
VGRNPQIVAPDGGGGDGTVIAPDTQSHLFQSEQGAVLFKSARRRLDPKSIRSRNDGIDSFRTGGDEASHLFHVLKMQPSWIGSHGAFYVRPDSIWPPVALKAARLCFCLGIHQFATDTDRWSRSIRLGNEGFATSVTQCLCLTGSASDGLQFILRR